MNWSLEKVRETFLDFFKEKNHTIVESSPILPAEDKTLLFTNAGMNQFKNVFTGQETRSYTKACSAQKCVRAGGKHNDLENVGFTDRHHTFFEMLGNFSFGDYFKEEAIKYSWELLTEVFKLDKERLYITVYKDDDEAFDIWKNKMNIPENKIFRLGDKDNFWAMGETGPCGPCSEIHYDLGEDYKTDEEHFLNNEPNWDCGRFVEIWNLVFMQFNRDKDGKMTPLPKPSIDTGMGLERITSVLNGKKSNYEIDLFENLIAFIKNLEGADKTAPKTSFRVIADHARATTFLIADSIMPSNEGRGYVLRRIMRRAIRHGNKVGFSKPFFHKVCEHVVELMQNHYKNLTEQKEFISKIVFEEEKRFGQTLDKGLKILNLEMEEIKKKNKKEISGKTVFTLYDTYGFPEDLTETILLENNLSYNKKEFLKAMESQKNRGKESWSTSNENNKNQMLENLKNSGFSPIPFDGYEKNEGKGKILAIIDENFEKVDKAIKGKKYYTLISPLIFYAESGGQKGDSGILEKKGKTIAKVVDCQKIGEYRFPVIIPETDLETNVEVLQKVDIEKQNATRRNHSATHLLHLALKTVLGSHVNQAGSLVSSSRLRFDFTHFAQISKDDLIKIEKLVNSYILANYEVKTEIKSIDEAKKEGATALFGEKYGETVRVVSMGESKELCGGTHVKRTGDIGLFKIVKEEGISAGTRRIEALSGFESLNLAIEYDTLLTNLSKLFVCDKNNVVKSAEKLKENLKKAEKEIETLTSKISSLQASSLEPLAEKNNIKIFVIDTKKGRKEVVALSDSLKSKFSDGLFVILGNDGKKSVLVVSLSGKAKEEYDAGKIIKEILSKFDGKGGGRKDMAQGGANNIPFEKLKNIVVNL